MPLPLLQCVDCKFKQSFKLEPTKDLIGKYTCSQFPDGIPDYVEEGTEDCPKFEEA